MSTIHSGTEWEIQTELNRKQNVICTKLKFLYLRMYVGTLFQIVNKLINSRVFLCFIWNCDIFPHLRIRMKEEIVDSGKNRYKDKYVDEGTRVSSTHMLATERAEWSKIKSAVVCTTVTCLSCLSTAQNTACKLGTTCVMW